MLIFDRLVLDVENLERALHFYTEALDFQVVTRGDWSGSRTALIQLGALHVLLLEQPGSSNPLQLPKSGPVITLSDVRIVDRYETIQRLGVDVLAPITDSPWGGRSFLIRDPDSYLIVIQEPSGQLPDGAW